LLAFEKSFHPLFNIAKGCNNRLPFNRVENRPVYFAIFGHIDFMGKKGCWRTSLEWQKLLFR
jgi:hypothetical protein